MDIEIIRDVAPVCSEYLKLISDELIEGKMSLEISIKLDYVVSE